VTESVVNSDGQGGDATRRDFIHIAAGAAAAGAGVMIAWPLINQMNPAADLWVHWGLSPNLAQNRQENQSDART
jgi:hypothetical protein